MDSSSGQHHHQEMSSQTLESMLVCTKSQQEKKPRPADMQALKCPRCESTNTKFCYYNNYSLSQPRYFCKSCRRYWTKGGTLRNVPVGGGCRKNKRSSSSSSSNSSSSKRTQDHPISTIPSPILNPLSYDSDNLTLAIARLQKHNSGIDNPDFHPMWANPNMPHHHGGGDFLGNFGLQNFYYGNMEVENGGIGINGTQEIGNPFEEFGGGAAAAASTAVKQEGESRVLWGFPWQNIGGDGGNVAAEIDSGRLNWSGIGSSYGLLNSPLM